MSSSSSKNTPSIRFVSVDDTTMGECVYCKRKGKTGTFCYHCCLDDGQKIGKCIHCHNYGRIGKSCFCNLGDSVFEEVLDVGECTQCGSKGMKWNLCMECEDQGFVYE